jgi:hypothetical protein
MGWNDTKYDDGCPWGLFVVVICLRPCDDSEMRQKWLEQTQQSLHVRKINILNMMKGML